LETYTERQVAATSNHVRLPRSERELLERLADLHSGGGQ